MTKPVPKSHHEELDAAMERAAVLHVALRHVAAAYHARHAPGERHLWTRCSDRFCRMAHDAVEGKYVPSTYSENGRVVSIKEKAV
jgi:hypothetical protein